MWKPSLPSFSLPSPCSYFTSMPQCNDALRSGGGDRHLWLTALPDNQIPAHPSPATLLNLRKSDRERRAVYHPGLFISSGWENRNRRDKELCPQLSVASAGVACLCWMQTRNLLTGGSDWVGLSDEDPVGMEPGLRLSFLTWGEA